MSMNLRKKIYLVKPRQIASMLFLLSLTLPRFFIHADGEVGNGACDPGKLCNPISYSTLQDFVASVLDIVMLIGIPIVAIFIIYSGYLFISAQGDPGKLKTAKETFLWTIVGAAVLLGSWV